jgi:hypothetical protein
VQLAAPQGWVRCLGWRTQVTARVYDEVEVLRRCAADRELEPDGGACVAGPTHGIGGFAWIAHALTI